MIEIYLSYFFIYKKKQIIEASKKIKKICIVGLTFNMSNIVELSCQQKRIYIQIKNGGIYVMKNVVENEVINEILEKCNWRERIIVKIFSNIFIKIYKIGITYGFNNK